MKSMDIEAQACCVCGGLRAMLGAGAENTFTERLTAPVISGFRLSTALCREWTGIQHPSGEYRPAVSVQFFSSPTSTLSAGHQKKDATNGHTRALKKRSQKGITAMFSAPIFSRTPRKQGV